MNHDIIKIFKEGSDLPLHTEDIKGGWCIINVKCTSTDTNCNVNLKKEQQKQEKEVAPKDTTLVTTTVVPVKK